MLLESLDQQLRLGLKQAIDAVALARSWVIAGGRCNGRPNRDSLSRVEPDLPLGTAPNCYAHLVIRRLDRALNFARCHFQESIFHPATKRAIPVNHEGHQRRIQI